eukprot:scaffold7487_cov33-Attheya_sp.AAC.1
MDQVPLPFVVEQEWTFTSYDDAHVHIRSCWCGWPDKEAIHHAYFVNGGDGQDGVCYIKLIGRGKPTMLIIAKKFCIKKRERHRNRRVLLFADNLDAHCWEEVLNEFASTNVLLVVFVIPGCTDAIQPIDAGIGRSI